MDSSSGERSFQYGRSISNQRIECWWSFLKKDTLQFWIDYFKDLRDSGLYDNTDNVHVMALKFSFYGCIQSELDETVRYWNQHKIRPSKGAEGHHGRPSLMYELPCDIWWGRT